MHKLCRGEQETGIKKTQKISYRKQIVNKTELKFIQTQLARRERDFIGRWGESITASEPSHTREQIIALAIRN